MRFSSTYRKIFYSPLLLLLLHIGLLANAQTNDIPDTLIGTIHFKEKSITLDKAARQVLDSLLPSIKTKPLFDVIATGYYADLCDECGGRSWDRANAVLDYLTKHGAKNRMVYTSNLDGELNKVSLSLGSRAPSSDPPPRLNLRNSKTSKPNSNIIN